ncbi:hypothetical protein [Carboxylicivirga caseinilyticus]|uniref:hypothetical protein n=1 Tax=Carboxylicivirga caseinilyticus TaxID=3417572 RepID=UPI003D343ECC|nr:hypothetical protein [Marinilabiliaceae bacterium A049]
MKSLLNYLLVTIISFTFICCEENDDKPECEVNNTGEVVIINNTGAATTVYVISMANARVLGTSSNKITYKDVPAGDVLIGYWVSEGVWNTVVNHVTSCNTVTYVIK